MSGVGRESLPTTLAMSTEEGGPRTNKVSGFDMRKAGGFGF